MSHSHPSERDQDWGPCRGARILIVDDDESMREILAFRLEDAGCVAFEAMSGREARDVLELRSIDGGIDLVLMDLRLPGPSGIQVLQALRATASLPPAILMTSLADDTVRAEALTLGVHVLDKPFTFDALRRIATLLILSKRFERSMDGGSGVPSDRRPSTH